MIASLPKYHLRAVVISVALCCFLSACDAATRGAVEKDSWIIPTGEVSLDLALDQVALLSAGKVTPDQIADLAGSLDLQVIRQIEEHSFVLGRSEPLSRKEIMVFARDVESKGRSKGLVLVAGMVMYAEHDPQRPILLTDELIVRLRPGLDLAKLQDLNTAHGVELVAAKPIAKDTYLLRVTPAAGTDSLQIANLYHKHEITVWAQPNVWSLAERRETIPGDALFTSQWHHHNTGQGGGQVDADIDTTGAWDFTQGDPDIVIAIIDDGFDLDHEDLAPNVYTNPGEIPGNGIDDDGNGYVDDVNGWDFACFDHPPPGCGDNDPRPPDSGANHGTAVAGMAVARQDGLLGVTGSCPQCRFLPLRRSFDFFPTTGIEDALLYTAQMADVDIISNSWGMPLQWFIADALWEIAHQDIMIFFAAPNEGSDELCLWGGVATYSASIAVSSSTNQDRRMTETSYGDCIDFLSPSHRGYSPPYRGTRDITTTDRTGSPGYNSDDPSPAFSCAAAEPTDTSYTHCFGGTSAATPLAAGVAGLIRTLAPLLEDMQVERLMQDTADKIEPGAAVYTPDRGFSEGPGGTPTHAWGRINAWEAVRIVAPVSDGGRDGIDIFMRDNHLDWGNTTGYQGGQASNVRFESPRGFIGHWLSPDIKIDAPPYHAPPTVTDFDSMADEKPSATPGDINRVFVRVRNRGPRPAAAVNVKLHWTQFGTALPALPADFWAVFPGSSADPTSEWHPLDCSGGGSYCSISDLGYSGASVATSPADSAQVVQFDFPAPAIDPMLASHFCLLAVTDSPDDPIAADSASRFVVDQITPNDNNITHRNYHDLESSVSRRFKERFLARNPTPKPILARLILRDAKELAARKWQVEISPYTWDKPFKLAAGETTEVTLVVTLPALGEEGVIEILQHRIDRDVPEVMGGLAIRLVAKPEPEQKE